MSDSLGPVMLDVVGTVLTPEDRGRLQHPAAGGVILFARNYEDPAQITALIQAIRDLQRRELLIAVDHEGGRVQRFREGFTELPPMHRIGEVFTYDPMRGQELARDTGWLLAQELQAVGVDFSFTPVLDRGIGISEVIGDRAFHERPDAIALLAGALLDGLAEGGMQGVGKHFPGHGAVSADSHLDLPFDPRSLADIEADDIAAFRPLLDRLGGIMPAHVVYSQVDGRAAGFSPIWLQELLRGRYGFDGAIFSDDLGMKAAEAAGGPADRAHAALDAGCDMVLIGNDPAAAEAILEALEHRRPSADSQRRLAAMRSHPEAADPARREAVQARLQAICHFEPSVHA